MDTPKRPKKYQRAYPWQPKPTHVQSFAAYRSGVLPALVLQQDGTPAYTLLDVFTKDGLAAYEHEHKRGIHAEPVARVFRGEKPTRKQPKGETLA